MTGEELSVRKLRALYRIAGVQKKILSRPLPCSALDWRPQEWERLYGIVEAIHQEAFLVFVDEAVFSTHSYRRSYWQAPGQHLGPRNDYRADGEAVAAVGAICREYGNLALRLEHRSITASSFRAFLVDLLQIAQVLEPGKKLQVFVDNASIHRSRLVTDFAEACNIELVFNLVRQPAFNGIEYFWAQMKRLYRAKVDLLKVKGQDFMNSRVVLDSYHQLSDQVAAKCAGKGVELIMSAYNNCVVVRGKS